VTVLLFVALTVPPTAKGAKRREGEAVRFIITESMTDPSYYPSLARTAEELGFDGMMVPDSICYPAEADTSYPYNRDGTRQFLDEKPFIEPMSLIPWLAAVTDRLEFVTSVVKLPIRHPVLVAKQVSSVAVITNNRLVYGVGTSPWPEDFRVVELPWEHRGRRMDEQIEIIRALTTGGYVEHHGEFYDFPAIKLCPVPTEPIPIVIGGHGDAALRRAARIGDGWTAAGADDEFIAHAIGRLTELRKEHGRDHVPFRIFLGSIHGFDPDGVKRMEELGVTDLYVGFRDPYVVGPDSQTLDEKLAALQWYAETVIAKVR
jgi:probable F420-dependent oxidoreductase